MVAVNYAATTFLCKTLDIDFYLRYNNFTFQYAGIAQLVEQRIRNAQVACSSHVSSSRSNPLRAIVGDYLFDGGPEGG